MPQRSSPYKGMGVVWGLADVKKVRLGPQYAHSAGEVNSAHNCVPCHGLDNAQGAGSDPKLPLNVAWISFVWPTSWPHLVALQVPALQAGLA